MTISHNQAILNNHPEILDAIDQADDGRTVRHPRYTAERAVLAGVMPADSNLSDRPSKSVGVPDPSPLLIAVRKSHQDSVASRSAFIDAVWAAHDAGFSNCRISSYVGMTEAGIRQILKRSKRGR